MNDEQWREWMDRHDREHEDPAEFAGDCEQCAIYLADRRYIAEQNVKAALAANPRTLRREHDCSQYIGLQSWCGAQSYEQVDGEWLCDSHAAIRRGQIALARLEEALESSGALLHDHERRVG